MNVLILGSGGREHTLAWKIAQSSLLTKLYIAPGNAGTKDCGENISLNIIDFEAIKIFCLEKQITMIVVGPEDPLVKGIYNHFKNDPSTQHIHIIGPSLEGAQLEGSKDFSKLFMKRHQIPTAEYQTFTTNTYLEGCNFLETLKPPYVLKADGLAAGKGVLILNDIIEAKEELNKILNLNKFGNAGTKVVIEEYLNGIECSFFVLTDGNNYVILPEAKDYKRIGNGDTGLNTGGMGAVSPVPFANIEFKQKVEDRIIKPTINGLKKENVEYKGFIFIGLMNVNGEPFVIEYNCRMGDPETEVVIPRIKNDLLELFVQTSENKLNEAKIELDSRFATTIMVVSGGYPENYEKNKIINGLSEVSESFAFHAGTTIKDNYTITSGGRVIALTSYGNSIQEAIEKSYASIKKIHFENQYFRTDIGKDLM